MSKSTLGSSQIIMFPKVTRVAVHIEDTQSQPLLLVEIVFHIEAGVPLGISAVGDGFRPTQFLPVSTDSMLAIKLHNWNFNG